MFDDILPLPIKECHQTSTERDSSWKEGCYSCKYASQLLSKYRNKLLCIEKKTHVDPNFFCGKWCKTS